MEEKTERGVRTNGDLALIVTGGFCDTDALKADGRFRESADGAYVIAADSGLVTAEKLGLEPALIVGDFDSYTGVLPEGPQILRVPAEKDETDTVLACRMAAERGYRRLMIAGGTGGRADHELSNILWLYALKMRGIDAVMTDGRNEFRVLRDESVRIPAHRGWYFSLFALGECSVTADGFRYPLREPTALTWENPSYAVSNEVTTEEAVVEAKGCVLLVRSRG